MSALRSMPLWIGVAIASGACAAFNGVFAKLTTTELTTSWASAVGGVLGLSPGNHIFEYLFRGFFFGLNLLFNAVMWALFTRALTLASSTVRVSVINTSANFMLTAVLGALIFGEALPPLWWLGASLLVAGSVIIGRREEGKEVGDAGTAGAEPAVLAEERERFLDDVGEGDGRRSSNEGAEEDDAVELATVLESDEEGDGRRSSRTS
ncbi:uncharacterized protein K452DRAFT_285840 [Aplosporella prunicola CBS 121167]|uniref:EamA domain-containing protein n=1 Tax=Aplosporella prunicola CBS 121167 TaxID=1176127 RepID=A0A6A6BKG8_9PEZI|nr:uncharacterized protein K452DRAFT_285840 [Aplosporella prunicola CBS 121167]KAF2143805.1 hypothetical protein K452DRAFT_285840 [Aplosporella prunicola CBS 121167]